MQQFSTIFNQILHLIPKKAFDKQTRQTRGNKYSKKFTAFNLFSTHLYAQIRCKESLRDIETSLNQHRTKWAHLGLRTVSKSTLSDANSRISYTLFESMFYECLSKCTNFSAKRKFKFKNPLFALDSTVIDLCLNIFEWAKFRKTKGALKLHCLLDLKSSIPSFIVATTGNVHDAKVAKEGSFPLSPDSIVTFDRGYIDYAQFNTYEKAGVFFITRVKQNMRCHFLGQHQLPRRKGLSFDASIQLSNPKQQAKYPASLRVVGFKDPDTGKEYVFLTNNFTLSAATIAAIYKSRWEIELFFKWIKQNLKIKSFLGTSQNAVLTQIWVAMIYFLILSYLKYQTKYRYSLLNLSRIIQETLLDRRSLLELLGFKPPDFQKIQSEQAQLALF